MGDTRIILAGQSNALGFLNTGPAPYAPTARVQIWCDTNGDGVPDAWNYMLPGHNTGSLANPNVWGPEVAFAQKWLAAHPLATDNLWIVKSAKGSTGLAEDPGMGILDWSPESTGELFDTTTAIVTAAMAALGGGPYAFTAYDGLLWMQGEQDATDQTKANAYLANLKDFITHVRAAWFVNLIVIGRITDSVNLPYNAAVRTAQWQEFMDDAAVPSFKTIGFDMQSDLIHYNAAGHIKLGNAFHYAFNGG